MKSKEILSVLIEEEKIPLGLKTIINKLIETSAEPEKVHKLLRAELIK